MANHLPASPPTAKRASLPAWPSGTVVLTVGRLLADTHQRGGRREHLGRVSPQAIEAFLGEQGPGRYRIACVGPGGRFLRGGAFAIEIGVAAAPQLVPARNARDYRTQPSALTQTQRLTRSAILRAEALRNKVRALERENARLREEARQTGQRAHAERIERDAEQARLREQIQRLAEELDRWQLGEGRGDVDPIGPNHHPSDQAVVDGETVTRRPADRGFAALASVQNVTIAPRRPRR